MINWELWVPAIIFLKFRWWLKSLIRPCERFGLHLDQIVVLMHSGSRGLGHQVCTDYLDLMQAAMKKYRIYVIDRQLACVPIRSREGQEYLSAMAAAANFAFANRQMITHRTRQAFQQILGTGDLSVVYDVCHNIAKRERHQGGRAGEGSARSSQRSHPRLS